ncbi:extracellular solute-binding protein [Atopobacter sp. AH10]|uniref:extracellular solute-binding protein n=1 Tax=Atopobacter sp. AH10 TaxID=2315861 RepID=UPI000EF26562|nr:extracellular solute-binding protein [Atopobacter sp. AH10]RLK63509.1 extracellular solute-binding protein [Atopobacter sp. AH10]
MKKVLKAVALLSAITIGSFACGKAGQAENSASKSDSNEKIVVYSNSVSDGRGDFLKEEAKKAGFDIEIADLGGNDLLNRVIAEKDAPVADVVFGMNQMMFSKVAKEGILESYKPKWLKDVDPQLVDTKNEFSPLQEQRVFMIYNADKIKPQDAPKSWEELAKSGKKYIVPKGLGGATSNAIAYSMLMNYRDKGGKYDISKKGWKAIQDYFKNGNVPAEGQSEIAELANGKADYSYTWLSNVPIVEKSFNMKLGIVNPTYGVPQTVEQVGIIKKKDSNKKVKAFVDFLGSDKLQAEWAKKFGSAPVNKKAQANINPRIKQILKETTPQKNDYKFINAHLDDWVEHIELNVLSH